MKAKNLRATLLETLDRVGRVQIVGIVEQLEWLTGWNNEGLATVMMDDNDVIIDEDQLLFLVNFFRASEATQTRTRGAFDKMICSLVGTLRHQPVTVGVHYWRGNDPKAMTVTLEGEGALEYVPIIAISVGRANGPLKNALDSMYYLVPREMTHTLLAKRFVHSLLGLWAVVLKAWIQPMHTKEDNSDMEIIASPKAVTVKAEPETPDIWADVEPVHRAVPRGVKRSRSQEDWGLPVRRVKQEVIPTPPRTPTVEVQTAASSRISRDSAVIAEASPSNAPVRPSRRAAARALAALNAYEADDVPPSASASSAPVRFNAQVIKSEDTQNRPAFIQMLLNNIPPHATPPTSDMVDTSYTFRRSNFSETFGSSPQGLETPWRRRVDRPHRPAEATSDWFIGASDGFNPYLPTAPCRPGLIFRAPGLVTEHGNTNTVGVDTPATRTVSIRIEVGKWRYMGEYVVRYSQPLPLAVWKSQSPKFRRGWAEFSITHYEGWERTKPKTEEMLQWLDEGTKSLEVYEMQCVGYVVALQAKIIALGLGN